MEFNEKEFEDFIIKFEGDFMNLLPDEIAVYVYKDTYYQLPDKNETLQMLKNSIENNVNLFLELPVYTFSEEDII